MKYLFYVLCTGFLAPVTNAATGELPTGKPNMVFILADDCSYWDIGCYGSPDAITPNIDRLAADGMRFTKCYQAAPMCSPTRHNLYTGLYPVKSGAYPNHTMAYEGTKSIVHYLKPLGYRVAIAGKTHIAPESVFPFEYITPDNDPDNFPAVEGFIEEASAEGQPFCLFYCSREPHTPWNKGNPRLFPPDQLTLPPFYVDTEEIRDNFSRYMAEINYLDWQVGRVLNMLDERGMADNTLVMFASEQGNAFPFAKWTCYDVGVHSALVARWPGHIQPGSVSDALVEYSDVVPTFIAAAGGEVPSVLDGKSLTDLFSGETARHKEYAYSIHTTLGINNGSPHYGVRSVVTERFRYIYNLTPEVAFQNNITEKFDWWKTWERMAETDPFAAWIVRKYQYRPGRELYDVEKDPYNMNNLADVPEYQKVVEELHGKLTGWMEACGDKGQATELDALNHMPKHVIK